MNEKKHREILAKSIAVTVIALVVIALFAGVSALLALLIWPLADSYGRAFAIIVAAGALTMTVRFFWGK